MSNIWEQNMAKDQPDQTRLNGETHALPASVVNTSSSAAPRAPQTDALYPDTHEDQTHENEATTPPEDDDQASALPSVGSAALAALPRERRPKPSTVCEICQASLWFASKEEVKCYCRVMHVVSWSTNEPNALTHCDGIEIANEE